VNGTCVAVTTTNRERYARMRGVVCVYVLGPGAELVVLPLAVRLCAALAAHINRRQQRE
jgi:hypothetical protein